MVDNPDRGDSYVPTTSSAKYLPRIGHHVYNGSAWVNEGLLAESEARTNIVTQSNSASPLDINTDGALSATDSTEVASPAGSGTVIKLDKTSSGFGYARFLYGVVTDTQTFSIFVKKGTARYIGLRTLAGNPTHTTFDFDTGTFVVTTGSDDRTAVEVGNGWYRLSITNSTTAQWASVAITNAGGNETNTETGTAYVFGFQRELGATPSSYIPTSGSSVTREAESFTIPSANLPWPTPQYIGDELVTNGTFNTDLSNWYAASNGSRGNITWNSETIVVDNSISNYNGAVQQITTEVGKVYSFKADLIAVTGTSTSLSLAVTNTSTGTGAYAQNSSLVIGQNELIFVAQSTTTYIVLAAATSTDVTYDNISVREINPLSVSITAEGRRTFADINDDNGEVYFWRADNSNYIRAMWSTYSARTGTLYFEQEEGGTEDAVVGPDTEYSPDILVPFNVASRHGSTFLNGAIDGVALTANTTPTALPDLSSTDLNLAYGYNGTISSFRVWDKDITDDGLEEATNPSLEPSLSLTFEGVGTNSFVVNDWAE
jgi:hypothetical protein